MVRSGQAVLVTRAAEVLELVSGAGEHLLPVDQGPARRTDELDPTRLGVFEALSARRWRTAGEVATTAGVRVPVCLAALSELESLGLATGDARGWRATPTWSGGDAGGLRGEGQRAPRRKASSSGPAEPEPDGPSWT